MVIINILDIYVFIKSKWSLIVIDIDFELIHHLLNSLLVIWFKIVQGNYWYNQSGWLKWMLLFVYKFVLNELKNGIKCVLDL